MATPELKSAQDIYRELRHGAGREHVTDANVDELIRLAQEHSDQTNEYLLKEWRSTCGEEAEQMELKPKPAGHDAHVHREF